VPSLSSLTDCFDFDGADAHWPVDRYELDRLTVLAVPLDDDFILGDVGDRVSFLVDDAEIPHLLLSLCNLAAGQGRPNHNERKGEQRAHNGSTTRGLDRHLRTSGRSDRCLDELGPAASAPGHRDDAGSRRLHEALVQLYSVSPVALRVCQFHRRRTHNGQVNSRVHPKYKTKYRVGNWPEYEQSLVQRGEVTLWFAFEAIEAWRPTPSGCPDGPRKFSNVAIETALTLRLVYRLPLRQTEGFVRSILTVMGIALEAPDHTTLSRRSQDPDLASVTRRPQNLSISSLTPPGCPSSGRASGRP